MIHVIVDGTCGRAGKTVLQEVAQQEDMQIVGAVASPKHAQIGQDAGEVAGIGKLGVPVIGDLAEILNEGDVVIEFTRPHPTIEHLRKVVEAGKAMVIGTTGFTEEELTQVHKLAAQIPCVMAPNMSVSINVLLQAIQLIAKVLGDEYDIEVIETHHNQKKDSPSGTALRIAEVLAEVLGRKLSEVGVYGRHGIVGTRSKQEIGIHAIRGGDIAGSHTVLFAATGEQLELTHRVHSREAYARGAIRAARWVVNAPKGLHDIQEVLL